MGMISDFPNDTWLAKRVNWKLVREVGIREV